MNKNHLQQMKAFGKLPLCPVIAGVNKKGGVGKTMLSCSIGTVLAYAGLRVLIIETCEQMNTVNLMAKDRSIKNSDHLSIVDYVINPEINIKQMIIPSKVDNLFILPASKGMNQYFTRRFESFKDGHKSILNSIEKLREVFDMIIIDSPPSDDLLPISAIAACSHYFFITDADNNASDGVRQIQKSIAEVSKTVNPNIQCLGILMNDKMKTPVVCQALIGTGGEPPFNYLNFMIPHSKKPISFAVTLGDGHWLRNAFSNQKIATPVEQGIYELTHFIMAKTGLIEDSVQ